MAFEPATFSNHFSEAIAEIEKKIGYEAIYMMLNILPPGITVPVHTDTLPVPVQRWHLPLQTNDQAYFWDELLHWRHLEPGYWHRIFPERRHTICNYGNQERIHLVVDLKHG